MLVAHNAAFDVRVLRQAFARAALEWPAPPVHLHGGRSRGASRRCSAAAGWRRWPSALGIEVDDGRIARCRTPRTCARVFCALFGRLSANAADDRRRARAAERAQGPHAAARRSRRARGERPHLAGLPHEPGVYIFRDADGRPLYVGKSVDLRTRARSHFTHRRDVGRGRRARRPPGDRVRARRAAARGPADQGAAPARQRARQERARRLRLPALPAGHPVPDPRGRARARRRPRGLRRPGARAGGRGRAGRAAQLAVRAAPLRAHAAAPRAPVGLRADGPLPLALPARPRPEPLPRAAGRGAGAVRRPRRRHARCSSASTRRSREASRRSATSARRRCSAAAAGWRRCSPGSAACCARRTPARGSCSRRTRRRRGASTRSGSPAGASSTGGRGRRRRSWRRARPAPTPRRPRRGSLGGWLPADAVAEARLVGAWIAANQPPALELGARTGEAAHAAFLARAGVHVTSVVGAANVNVSVFV